MRPLLKSSIFRWKWIFMSFEGWTLIVSLNNSAVSQTSKKIYNKVIKTLTIPFLQHYWWITLIRKFYRILNIAPAKMKNIISKSYFWTCSDTQVI